MKHRLLLAAVAAAAATAVTACGAPGSSAGAGSAVPAATQSAAPPAAAPGSITLGSADFPENEVLAWVYADAFKAKGVTVTVHADIGERPVYMTALQQGSIGGIIEYSGALLDYLDYGSTARTPAAVYRQLQQQAGSHGLEVTSYAPAQDVDTITVTRATAARDHLHSIADLRAVARSLSLGAPEPFQTVSYGTPALQKDYGVTFGRFVALQPSGLITQTALADGTVSAADIFSTDPSITRDGFVPLADPKSIFAAENIVPVFRDGTLTRPMAAAADAVSARLTTAQLRSLDVEVAAGQQPAAAAAAWDRSQGLT